MSDELYFDATNYGERPLGNNWDYWQAIDELSTVSKHMFDEFIEHNAKAKGVKAGQAAAHPKNMSATHTLVSAGFLAQTGTGYLLTDLSVKYINQYVENYR